MATYDVRAVVSMWHARFGDLAGANQTRLDALAPIASDEIEAVEQSPAVSWAYAIKVISSTRDRRDEKQVEKVRLSSGEFVTVVERDLRALVYEAGVTAFERLMERWQLKRGDFAKLTDRQKSALLPDLREAIEENRRENEERDRECRARGERNTERLRALTRGVGDAK